MYQRIAPIAATVLAAGLALAGCSSGDSSPSQPGKSAATTVAVTATAADHKVKLSTKWVPKLDALSNGTGVSDCRQSGSAACMRAQTADLNAFTGILKDIDAAGATAEYPKTIAEINQLVRAADTFNKDGCPGDPNADVDGAPCSSNAMAVTVGVTTLSYILPTDELNAGVN